MIYLTIRGVCLHRRLFPRAKEDRAQHFFLSVMLPNHAIRTADFVTKHFFVDCHPLALAEVAAGEEELIAFKRSLARDIAFPIPSRATGPSAQVAKDFREKFYLPAVEKFLSNRDELILPPEEIVEPAYCPALSHAL